MFVRTSRLLFTVLMVLAALSALLLPRTPAALAAGTVLYVNDTAGGGNTGADWANAYTSLQSALTAAGSGPAEIWVATGTYTPTTTTDRTATFTLKNNVAIYGGFAGTETLLSERNWATNVVTFSGEIGAAGNSDNSYHVVTGGGTDATAILDGVTISGGNANGDSPNERGGGMYNESSSPTLENVTFSGNSASYGGGMINFQSSSPTLSNVTFSGNAASYGGGMINFQSSSPTLTNVTFSGNAATTSGGGMYNDSSNPTLSNVTFSGNAASYGGGMINFQISSPTLSNVTISGNSASFYGGGMYNSSSSPTLSNVTFSGNSATDSGGGMYNLSSSNPTIRNSIVWGNSGTQIFNDTSTPAISYSIVQGGYTGTGNLDADPLFVNPIAATSAPTTTGNYRLKLGSPAINAGNNAVISATTDMDGNPRIIAGTVDNGCL